MAWLLGFILAHSAPTTLNAWACDYVIEHNRGTDGGCYDICYAFQGDDWFKLTHDEQNACGVVMNGGEY